jgi:hypothetical protein
MERRVQVFRSFEEAERAENAYYASLSPQQRVDLLLDLLEAWRESCGHADQGLARVHRVVKLSES